MSPKLPLRGVITVDVHTRAAEPTTGTARRPTAPATGHEMHTSQNLGRTPADVDLDEIRPAPVVSISPTSYSSQPVTHAVQEPLKHYWIGAEVQLPEADAEGFRFFKGRRYVDVPDGGTVHVLADPQTGQYRARLTSELQPSGPVLSRDPDSNLWRPLDDFAPIRYPLTANRLEAFRAHPDFTDVVPDPDHLHRFNGKLYVVIDKHAYQVLHDQDCSSPHTAVMRIVRPEDPIARDDLNRFVATRPGRSEPVVYDPRIGWMGMAVGGVSGMPNPRRNTIVKSAVSNVTTRLTNDTVEINAAVLSAIQLETEWHAAKGLPTERDAVVKLEVQIRRLIPLLEKSRDYYLNRRNELALVKDSTVYKKELLERQIALVGAYTRLMIVRDTRSLQELRAPTDILETYRTAAKYLEEKLATMEKRQQTAADVLKSSPSSQIELTEAGFDPYEIHTVTARWVDARSRLLTDVPTGTNFIPARLAGAFAEVTLTFQTIEDMPYDARIAVLSMMLDQCAAIRASYQRFALPADAAHAKSRDEITQAIQAFETTVEEHLDRYHHNLEKASALPVNEQPIDFDFIPAQDRAGPAQAPRRVFRARHHGTYRICIGQPRRTLSGEEVIDVMSTDHQPQALRTYERHEGEWQRIVPTRDTPLDTLMAEATQGLEQTESHLHSARQEERARETASNILHTLDKKAEELDDLRSQIERAPNPLATVTAPLIQRLRQDSQRLRDEGENIRVRLYKDKTYLSADRIAYLISHGHLSAKQTLVRAHRGKGEDKHYLDIYVLNDRQTREPLWHAHFKYDRPETPAMNFKVKGGHLKTLAQSGSGASSQRMDEQAGRPHVAIWRHTLDGRTAEKIFALAHANN